MRKWLLVLVVASTALAACSSGSSSDGSGDGASGSDDSAEAVTEARSAAGAGSQDDAPDAAPPEDVPAEPAGASGYSPYVFEDNGADIVTTLVEGPRGEQTRCQDVDLPCSYLELKELAESGRRVPEELEMTRAQLEELVAQLDEVRATIDHYRDINTACADGYVRSTDQVPNMGAHFLNSARTDGDFVPSEPEMLLYVTADGQLPAPGTSGHCKNDRWEGAPMEITGVSFVLPVSAAGEDHPEGFAGPLDNWHVHFNLCSGPSVERGSRSVHAEACQQEGGIFLERYGWMMHAWADPEHDNQLGVFSMWNPTITPVSDPAAIRDARTRAPDDLPAGAAYFSISNFNFDTVEVDAGDPVVFANADGVTHTVSAGSAKEPGDGFDSGQLAPGQTYEVTFDEPGAYRYYCSLHPQMNGKIVIDG